MQSNKFGKRVGEDEGRIKQDHMQAVCYVVELKDKQSLILYGRGYNAIDYEKLWILTREKDKIGIQIFLSATIHLVNMARTKEI